MNAPTYTIMADDTISVHGFPHNKIVAQPLIALQIKLLENKQMNLYPRKDLLVTNIFCNKYAALFILTSI